MLNALTFLHTFLSHRLARRLNLDDRGVTAVEYGLLLALIAMVIVVAVVLLGQDLSKLFSSADTCVANNNNCPAAPAGGG